MLLLPRVLITRGTRKTTAAHSRLPACCLFMHAGEAAVWQQASDLQQVSRDYEGLQSTNVSGLRAMSTPVFPQLRTPRFHVGLLQQGSAKACPKGVLLRYCGGCAGGLKRHAIDTGQMRC